MLQKILDEIGNGEVIIIATDLDLTSVANCCSPPIFIGPSSEAYRLQPPTHKSLVGHTIPHVSPSGLSENIAFAAP